MEEKLKKIKELLGKSIDDSAKKDLYIGQALGLLDSMLVDLKTRTDSKPEDLPIPDMVWKHVEKPNSQTMMDAVQRHKQIHNELSRDSVTQQNTQFEQLK